MELRYTFDPERFYLGTLCKHGHKWPGTQQSLRSTYKDKHGRTVNHCIGCTGKSWLIRFIDLEASGLPAGKRLGKPCKGSHFYLDTGLTLRNKIDGKCSDCEAARKSTLEYRLTQRAACAKYRANLTEQEKQDSRRKCNERARIRKQENPDNYNAKKRKYKQAYRKRLIANGLTSRGKPVLNPVMQTALLGRLDDSYQELAAYHKALNRRNTSPSVARLVMDEQRRYWREHPQAKREHDKQWARVSWWLEYQTKPDLRLYIRQKSKRRKAMLRNQTAHHIKPKQLRDRFAQFDNCCAYCGDGGNMQIEHVVPISKGGTHALGNIVPACQRCNFSKLDKDAQSWYQQQPYYSQPRWQKICRVLGWNRSSVGQLALL